MSELQTQHENWKAARARLNRLTIKPRLIAPRPAEKICRPAIIQIIPLGKLCINGPVTGRLQGLPDRNVIAHCVQDIQRSVCVVFGVGLPAMKSAQRSAAIIPARHTAIMLAAHLTTQSLPAIGMQFNRDHTTILHAVRKMVPVLSAIDPKITPECSSFEWARGALKAYREVNPHARGRGWI